MNNTKIQWTDATWNPVVGCTKVSAGCDNCYAEKMAGRLAAMGVGKYMKAIVFPHNEHGKRVARWSGEIGFDEKELLKPLTWKKPRKIFVVSMGDLFHENVPFNFIDRVFAVMASCGRHIFQVLTKRPERMLEWFNRVAKEAPTAGESYERRMREHFKKYKMEFKEGYSLPDPPTPEVRFIYDSATIQEQRPTNPCGTTFDSGFSGREFHWRQWPLSNVWLGVTAENQEQADERIPIFLQCPAAVRFVSVEPMLGPVDLTKVKFPTGCVENVLDCRVSEIAKRNGIDKLNGLDWVICGGESGPHARPMHPDWARSLRDQCKAAGVPFFFKQWGEWLPVYRDKFGNYCCDHHCGLPKYLWDYKTYSGTAIPESSDGYIHAGKKLSGDLLDGVQHHEFPEE